jgi:hypothetical protein
MPSWRVVSFVLLSLAEVSFSVITTRENPVGLSFVVEALSGTEESKQRNRKKRRNRGNTGIDKATKPHESKTEE